MQIADQYAQEHTSNAQALTIPLPSAPPPFQNGVQLFTISVLAKSGALAATWVGIVAVNWTNGQGTLMLPFTVLSANNPSNAPAPNAIIGPSGPSVTITGVNGFEIDWLIKWEGEELVIS